MLTLTLVTLLGLCACDRYRFEFIVMKTWNQESVCVCVVRASCNK